MEVKGDKWYRLLHPKIALLLVVDSNVMALAWAMPVDDEAKTLAISMWKGNYSYELLEREKEFSLCIPTAEMLKEVWFCGTKSGREVNKIKSLNLELEEGVKIKAPHIKNCAGFLECRVIDSVSRKELGEHAVYFVRVLYAQANEKFFDTDKKIWKENASILMHVGGNVFSVPSGFLTP